MRRVRFVYTYKTVRLRESVREKIHRETRDAPRPLPGTSVITHINARFPSRSLTWRTKRSPRGDNDDDNAKPTAAGTRLESRAAAANQRTRRRASFIFVRFRRALGSSIPTIDYWLMIEGSPRASTKIELLVGENRIDRFLSLFLFPLDDSLSVRATTSRHTLLHASSRIASREAAPTSLSLSLSLDPFIILARIT